MVEGWLEAADEIGFDESCFEIAAAADGADRVDLAGPPGEEAVVGGMADVGGDAFAEVGGFSDVEEARVAIVEGVDAASAGKSVAFAGGELEQAAGGKLQRGENAVWCGDCC